MKKLVFLLILFLPCGQIFAQSPPNSTYPDLPHPEWFKTIPPIDENTPDWALEMYSDDPNVFEIVDGYHKYFQENEFVKTVHVQNYKYLLKVAGQYVNDQGYIRPPSREQEEDFYKKIKKRYAETLQRSMNPWVSIGPFETYKSGTMQPYSNQVNIYSLDQSNTNPDILFAGTESGGVYKTTDHGLNWALTNAGEEFAGGNTAVQIHPTNPDLVIVASNKRLYRTTDGGATWNEVVYFNSSGYEIKFRPSNPDSVFCVAGNGLYLSTDAGATWPTQIFTETCHDVDWHTSSPDTVYLLKSNTAAVRSELFMSPDGGANWYLKDNGYYSPSDPANASISGGKIALTAADPDRVYVCLIGADKADDNGWIGVVRSNDRGESWTVPAGQYGGPYNSVNVMPWNVAAYTSGYHQGFYNFDCEASPNDPDLLWIGTIRLSESSDGGASFIGIGAANSQRLSDVHADIQDIEVNGDEVWVANDGGIEHSTDKLQSFTSRKKGIAGSNFWGFGSGWNEDVLVGGRYHNGNAGYYQTYGVGNSIKLGGVEESTGYVHPIENRKAFFNQSWSGGTAVRSVPDAIGGSYTTYSYLPKIPNESYWESNSSGLYFDPRYADHYFMGEGSSIWKSTDAGITWQELNNFGADGRTLEIDISRSNPDYIYVVFKPDGTSARSIYRTTNGGSTWSQLANVPTNNRNKLEISLNPENENELWVSCNDGNNSNKVFKTLDGGSTWVNMTTASLSGEDLKDIHYQGGTDDVVYLATQNTIFYYDKNANDWVDYGNGLPLVTKPLQMKPFYRDGKLRVATSGRGIWEAALAEASSPVAQPITYADSVFCSRDTVQFDCYSVLDHAGASWQWAFSPAPLWVSSTTERNPRVVFGANGSYDVTLTVTDGSANSDSKTITDMVKVNSFCEPDTVAGQVLRTAENGDYFISQDANLTDVTHFTVTGWWKPSGAQQAYAALFSSGDWCAHCDYTEGLIFDYYASKLWYKWPGMADNWGSNSGITIPLDEWSYVALVIEPTQATLYLNDQKYVHVKELDPGTIETIHIGYGHYSKSFKGDIDEVTIWKKALSESEIRRMRHLTKEDEIGSDPDLIGYWQFNEFVGGNRIMDHGGSYHGSLNGGATLAPSTVPVGGGASQILDLSAAQTEYDFPQAGAKIFMSDCEEPNGQLVVSRLNVLPDSLTNATYHAENYWVLNYYPEAGSGQAGTGSWPPFDSIELTSNDAAFVSGLGSSENAILHLRSENEHLDNWQSKAKGTDLMGSTLRFDRKSTVEGASQIFLTNQSDPFNPIDPGRICEADTIPGNALDLPGGSGNYAVVPQLDLNTNTFSASVWINPDGLQNDNAGIVFCRGGTTTSGIHIKNDNEVRYHWDGGKWGWSSGAFAPADEWTHVALVVEPTQATIYVNGVPYVNTGTHAAEAFDHHIRIGNDPNSGSRTFRGLVDEVCIWDRALTQDEVRELMHLTKEDILATDPNLQVYLQFNEASGKSYDKTSNRNHATMNSGSVGRAASTAPFGGGVSSRMDVTAGGVFTFGNTGVSLGFNPSATTYPDGELVVTRINVPPDETPANGNIVPDSTYWVIRNFGANQAFDVLDSLVFDNVPSIWPVHEVSPSQFSIFKRNSNDFGATWGTSFDDADLVTSDGTGNGKITFAAGNGVTSFSQFAIGDAREVQVNVKVFLEGPYDSGLMGDGLRSGSHLPTGEPYTGLNFAHKSGGGGESCSATVFSPTGNDAIVDWLLVELRDKNDPANVLFTRSALLQRDGDVVDMDGNSLLTFRLAPEDDYFVAVRHRNHLGAMTATAQSLSATPLTINFTDGSTATWGSSAQKDLGSSTFALWASDLDASGVVDAADRSEAWNNRNLSGYLSSDATMDGVTDETDRNLSWNNRNLVEQLPE